MKVDPRYASVLAAWLATSVLVAAATHGGGVSGDVHSPATPAASEPVAPTTAKNGPEYGEPRVVGTVRSRHLVEASGLVASRKNRDVLWTHNDSGDVPRVFALRTDGKLLATYSLTGARAFDWEDIAIGGGPRADSDYLYLGDIGDNADMRRSIIVWRVEEPRVDAEQGTMTTAVGGAEALPFSYPDGAHDAETLIVDPLSGDLFVITKEVTGRARVFRAAAPLTAAASHVLERVGTLAFGSRMLPGNVLATGGDISPDGTLLAMRNYTRVFVWTRRPDESVAQAFARDPVATIVHVEQQGEAVAFAANGSGLYTLSEGAAQPLYFIPRTN